MKNAVRASADGPWIMRLK